MVHPLEEGHVVQRVAVEPAFAVAEAAAEAGEPLVDARDLALAEARGSARLPGEVSADLLEVGRDQVLDAELPRDGRGDEAVGRGDDGADLSDVVGEELDGALADDRTDLALDRKSTRLNSSHIQKSRMPSSA